MNIQQLYLLLEELISLPSETNWVEFKMGSKSITNDQKGEYISAMSNGATIANKPFGYIVWGVEDETQIVKGTNFTFQNAKEGNQDLELWIRNLLHPKINFDIFEFKYNDKNIVLLRIPAAKYEPTHFKKMAYIRIGSNKTDLRNFPEYVRIIYNYQDDWSAKIIENASIDDLDIEAIDLARIKFKEGKAKASYFDKIDNWSDEEFLDKAKININGKLTNTSIILLGKEESTHLILPSL